MILLAFECPVFGIGRRISFGVIQGEELRHFRDTKAMETCDGWALDHDELIGMRLVDGTGRSWRIRGVRRLRLSGNLLQRVIAFLCRDQRYERRKALAQGQEHHPDHGRD